jgi:hypothetical protein
VSRVANQFNFANRAPMRMSLTSIGEKVEIELAMCGISSSLAESIWRKLQQQLMVTRVERTTINGMG